MNSQLYWENNACAHSTYDPDPFSSSSSKGLGGIPSQELKPRKAHRGKERKGAREGGRGGRGALIRKTEDKV